MKGKGGKELLRPGRTFSAPLDRLNFRRSEFPKYRTGAHPLAMPGILAGYWQFLVAGLFKQGQTGGVIPSQRFLISQMLVPVPQNYTGRVVELGAGTGALTLRLAAKCPAARILACEINPALAKNLLFTLALARLTHRAKIVPTPAELLLARLRTEGSEPPDFIISGLPLGNMDREAVLALLNGIHSLLAPGGIYIQFQHSLLDRKKIKERFARVRTIPVLLNLPPAVVYYAQK